MAPSVLVLASGSPRRKALLETVGLKAVVRVPDVDEHAEGDVRAQTFEIARRKADAVAPSVGSGWLIAADTLVAVDGAVIGKPAHAADAARILARLAGRTHEVVTAVVVLRVENGAVATRAEDSTRTAVTFCALPPGTIDAYVATQEPLGKAGAYAIQGLASAFIDRIDGSVSNVVGLPITTTLRLLAETSYPLPAHLRTGKVPLG